MSGQSLGSLSAAECEFLAENELVTINPTFKQRQFDFISGTYGPFEPYVPVDVPLWLAVSLLKKGKCRLVTPGWMSVDSLEQTLADEKTSAIYTPLPFHYMEIAMLLLNNAPEEFIDRDKIFMLLQDIENIRMERIKLGFTKVAQHFEGDGIVHSAALLNIGSIELFSIKKLFPEILKSFLRLAGSSDAIPVERGGESAGSTFEEDSSPAEDILGRPKSLRRFRG